MQTKLKNRQGFTIIEIMIVLAIAGLIMLIVFLAVPALQRSSRNTSRKNDAGNFSSSLSTWISDNNGTLPGNTATGYNNNKCTTDVTTIATNSVKLGYYTTSEFSCSSPTATVRSCTTAGVGCGGGNKVGTENVVVQEGVVCASPLTAGQPMTTTSGASARGYVVLYEVEQGSNATTPECIGG